MSCIGYLNNYNRGFDLCRKRNHKPKKVEIYVSINGHGRLMGLTDVDLPKIKITKHVTIQPPPNQLANIDFDVIGTSDY